MKIILIAVAVLMNAFVVSDSAFAIDVGTLPMPDFADTEVSTNGVVDVSAEAPRRLRFSLELEATPSNESVSIEFVESGFAVRVL